MALFILLKLATIGLVAYWIYMDARSRDSHPIIWAASAVLVGLFGVGLAGPILLAAVIGVYLWRRPKGKMRLCPFCKKPVLAALAGCPHCKQLLLKDCFRCFAAVDVTSERCPECNAKLS